MVKNRIAMANPTVADRTNCEDSMMEIFEGLMPDLSISLMEIISPADPIMPAKKTGIKGIRYLIDNSDKNTPIKREHITHQMALLTITCEIVLIMVKM